MADFTVAGYDVIGDVHGCADQMEALLVDLGYRSADGAYRHPTRQAVFVGDLIDRGEQQLRVLEIAKGMVDAGSAQIVMGNHEFNALAYHTEWPPGSGKYLRPHDDPDDHRSEKNTKQHRAFLEQVQDEDRRRYLNWFATLPLWLDLGGVRVVHACWHDESMALVRQRCGSSVPFTEPAHLVAAGSPGDRLYDAVETLLKGPEISLVAHHQPPYRDKDGHVRTSARMRWWDSDARWLRDIAEMGGIVTTESGAPYPELPEQDLGGTPSYVYAGDVPVIYGHYWRQSPATYRQDWTERTACVDFSAVNHGTLTAYRWSGEDRIRPDHYAPRADAETV